MKSCLLLCFSFFYLSHFAQQTFKPLGVVADERAGGLVLLLYKIPQDGYYVFTVEGSLHPGKSCTLYFCEYQFLLQAGSRIVSQPEINIASQAQDGNPCQFSTNAKVNKIAGIFHADELVQLRLQLHRAQVNGAEHQSFRLGNEVRIYVKQLGPGIAAD